MTTVPPDSFDQAYYATAYRDYDRQNPPRKLACYRNVVAGCLPPTALASPRILDLGCGFGRFVGALDPRWQAYGADVSEFAIGRASAAVPGARFAVMRQGTIPFAERFDAITAWDVLEHIPDLDHVAAQVTDHLVANGAFAFAVPVYDGPLGRLVNWLDKDTTHVHRASRGSWLEWAGRHFELVRWCGAFRYLLPSGHYLHWTTHVLRRVAPAAIVTARRRG